MTRTEQASIGAAFVAVLGVEAQVLFWACVGTAGASLLSRPAEGGIQQSAAVGLAKFLVVALLSALFATYIGHEHLGGRPGTINALAGGLSLLFQYLLTVLIDLIPALAQLALGILRARFGGDRP